jgi:hypothetical protein
LAWDFAALYCGHHAKAQEIGMNNANDAPSTAAAESGNGPLRHFRFDRRTVLQTLATGVGVVALAPRASAAHAHHAVAAAANTAEVAMAPGAQTALLFLDPHGFDTLASLGEQIVPGSRAAGVPEFLDRLLSVESTETQKYFMQALGTFERAAREAHGVPWKALTAEQATASLTQISTQPAGDAARQAFERIKVAVAETYYGTEAGMKELGWNGSVAFAAPAACTPS